eukprot:6214055-Pleurochrysis_carterae.AAC.1
MRSWRRPPLSETRRAGIWRPCVRAGCSPHRCADARHKHAQCSRARTRGRRGETAGRGPGGRANTQGGRRRGGRRRTRARAREGAALERAVGGSARARSAREGRGTRAPEHRRAEVARRRRLAQLRRETHSAL